MTRLPTVAVVGFPNVGKSTLVNRLAGGREAVTHAEPGVTRDRKRVRCEGNGLPFELLDTGGIDLEDESELAPDIQRPARVGIAKAEGVQFLLLPPPRARACATRDAIDTELEIDGGRVILVDTAGLRRRSKVAGTVDYYAQLRSEHAVERADVALVVCDASDGITAEDLRVAELAMKAGC